MSLAHHSHDGAFAGYEHPPKGYNRAFLIGFTLNLLYIVAEVVFGLISGSLALLADAGHNLSDVLGLAISWAAHYFSSSPPTGRRTYGLRRASILAALANALILLVAIGVIVWEAIHRLMNPQPPSSLTIVWVAGAGILVNGLTAYLFAAGREHDLNLRGTFVHMSADAGVSAAVVLGGLAIHFTGLAWIDPALSLLVAAVIAVSTWGLLRDSVALSLDWVPRGIDMAAVHRYLASLPNVQRLHDLHVWPLSTTETALTVHLVVGDTRGGDALLAELSRELKDRFGIRHTTVQFEQHAHSRPSEQCSGQDCA